MKISKGVRNLLAGLLTVLLLISFFVPHSVKELKTDKKAVFSIDAGRKYFSVEELESLIDKASECGYTDFQLILGNDGLRFILDDMTVVTENGIYDGNLVREAIAEGNNNYYKDEDGNYLTEAEMNEILAFAKEKGIKIIPLVNSPGHMDSILYAMEKLGIEEPNYKGSIRTVDLENMEAVTFTKVLLNKYMEYFSGQCEIFNIGCDEYANDIDNGGWKRLQSTGKYKEFIKYVNMLATDVKEYGMEPMCFNDGIYYSNDDSFGVFNKDLIISYWHNGWIGYNPASAKYLADKGHRILNTNYRWYWVVGNFRKRDHGNEYTYRKAEDGAKNLMFNGVPGGGNVPTIGSMQCVWYDYPENKYDHNLVINLMELFREKNMEYM